ncbi:hypothetical protein C5612_29520 [Pseudomonas frederiksbergensis]|uniref:Uncharacterized protein n=1 Tax=Pseudomonas frederiksbergensis TaxID=104087 RepID=A0A2S8H5K4_9PSED|nr:hypothetical protein C5612_29520 [Pseudomonas frederiksbergensis]
MASELVVARGLAPVRLRSSRKPANSVCLIHLVYRFGGRFAAQRGQAPSPRQAPSPQVLCSPRFM